MDASEPKGVNSISNIIGVISLRLGGLYINYNTFKTQEFSFLHKNVVKVYCKNVNYSIFENL